MNNTEIKHTITIYTKLLKHLQHHLAEGNFDKLDVDQSKMLKREIKKLEKLLNQAKKGGLLNKVIQLEADEIPKTDILYQYSNPLLAQDRAYKLLGDNATLYKSFKKNKKYMIIDPSTNHWIHFGQLLYEDYLHHMSEDRRNAYLKRSEKIKGNWQSNPYSPNNLSRNILW